MRQKTYFKSCIRDIEFPGQELDSRNTAGAMVGYVPWPRIFRVSVKSRTSPQKFGIRQVTL